jgi:nitrite reductase/ring-hydroxylating ferredoxin subunit
MTLKLAIENAIHKAAPEIEQVLAEGAPTPAHAPGEQLLQIELAGHPKSSEPAREALESSSWTMAGGMPELANGGTLVKPIGGQQILFLKLSGRLYGYRPLCPACRRSMAGAAVEGVELSCPGCGLRYDALRAGRCLEKPSLHLEPVPLLVGDDGLAKVALAGMS